jgi:zinc protease
VTLPDAVQLPRLYCAWHSERWNTREDALMDVCTDILNEGKNSRLYRSLVIEQQIAQTVVAYQHGLEQTGRTVLQITPQPGHSLDEVNSSAMAVLDQFLAEGPTEHEVQKSVNIKKSHHVHGLAGMLQRADGLASCHTVGGSARLLLAYLERFEGITPTEVRECAARIFRQPPVVLSVVPNGKGAA